MSGAHHLHRAAPAGLSKIRMVALTALSALFLVLAQPPFHVPLLPFLTLVPFSVVLASLPPGRRGGLLAVSTGTLFGLVFWSVELIWVPVEVGAHFAWAYAGFALLLVLLGGLAGLFAWLVHFLLTNRRLPLVLALPLGWVGVEWVKVHFPGGLEFPWLGLAVTLARWPDLLGIGEWVGESGVAFWIAAVNGFIAAWILATDGWRGRAWNGSRHGSPSSRWSGGRRLATPVALALPFALGPLLAMRVNTTDGPRILVLGTNVGTEIRANPAASARASLAQVQARVTASRRERWDLVVLPEAFLPMPFNSEAAEAFRNALEEWQGRLATPLLFGSQGRTSGGAVTNSVFLMARGGSEIQRYDKTKLVPGMELGAYGRGSGGGGLAVGGWTFGPLLCYESLFGGLARTQRLAGAQVLVNLSSDIWFGSGEGLVGSLFLKQHPAHLVLRAVENRVPVARAANGGYSFLMDPRGRILSDTVSPLGGLAEATVPFHHGITLFTRFGDLVGPATVLLCIFLVLTGFRGSRLLPWSGAGSRRRPSA